MSLFWKYQVCKSLCCWAPLNPKSGFRKFLYVHQNDSGRLALLHPKLLSQNITRNYFVNKTPVLALNPPKIGLEISKLSYKTFFITFVSKIGLRALYDLITIRSLEIFSLQVL